MVVVVAAALLRWGAGPVRSFLLRPVPWNQWVVLHVWTSLAVDAGGGSGGDQGIGTPSQTSQAGGSGLRRALAIAQVHLEDDVAAVSTRSETRLPVVLPAAVRLLSGGLALTLMSVDRDGIVVLRFDGREQSLAAGRGLDWALVPSTTARAGGWVVHPGQWREVVLSRLEAGLPVGRISLVNHGLQRKSAALWAGPDDDI
ncbi:MAG: hypothetical protein Q8P31_11805 [Bacillota bacterium]|nr:hypothetical protein [Bacillota bacterium]